MHSSRLLALLIRKRYPAKALLGSDPKWHPGRRCSEFGLWEPKKDRQDRCAQVISNFPNCFLQIGQFVKFDWVRSTHHAAFPRSMAELSAGRPHNGHQINSITFHSPATALPHRVDTYPGLRWANSKDKLPHAKWRCAAQVPSSGSQDVERSRVPRLVKRLRPHSTQATSRRLLQ